MSRFNFTLLARNIAADILDIKNNFNKIEENAAIIDDLPKTKQITLSEANWISINDGEYYRYTVSDALIQPEPYNIDIIFNDLTLIEDCIYPKANSQANGSLILETKIKPTIDLTARLIVTKGVQQ